MASGDIRPQFTLLANSLGGACRWGQTRGVTYVERFDFVRDGIPFFCEPNVGSKGGLFGAEIFAPLRHRPIAVCTTFTREGDFDRFGKSMGITREFQTGDPAFDQTVFIDSRARDPALARLLSSPDVRRAIQDIVSMLRVSVTFVMPPATGEPNQEYVRVSIATKDLANIPLLEQIFPALTALVRAVDHPSNALGPYGRAAAGAVDETPLPIRRGRIAIAGAMVIVPAIVSIALPAGHTLGSSLEGWGFLAGAVLWLVYGFVFAMLFRGRSSSLPAVAWAWAFALIMIPFVASVPEGLNAFLDDGPTSKHMGTAELHIPAKGSSYVEVHATWLHGSPSTHAPNEIWLLGSEGVVPVTAVTRPGAFGVPWLVSARRPVN